MPPGRVHVRTITYAYARFRPPPPRSGGAYFFEDVRLSQEAKKQDDDDRPDSFRLDMPPLGEQAEAEERIGTSRGVAEAGSASSDGRAVRSESSESGAAVAACELWVRTRCRARVGDDKWCVNCNLHLKRRVGRALPERVSNVCRRCMFGRQPEPRAAAVEHLHSVQGHWSAAGRRHNSS